MKSPTGIEVTSSAPIFFVGMPRSGTTILFEAVARHPLLAWPSNYCSAFPHATWVNAFRRLLDNPAVHMYGRKKQYGRVLPLNRFLPQPDEAYEFWNAHTRRDFARSSLLGVRADDQTIESVRSAVGRLVRWQNRPRFAAKFTGPARIEFLRSIFPDAMFVHVIRDGRAVVHSLMRVDFWKRQGGYEAPFWSELLDPASLADWETGGRDPGVLAGLQWRRVIELARRERSLLAPTHYLEVHYEDFLADPHAFLTDLFRRCGLPDARAVHAHIASGPELRSMNKKFENELTPQYVERLTATMEPIISELE